MATALQRALVRVLQREGVTAQEAPQLLRAAGKLAPGFREALGGAARARGLPVVEKAPPAGPLAAIEAAGALEPPHRLAISYRKRTTGELVEREIRPYEVKPHPATGNLVVYATDTLHGSGQIHSFLVGNIRSTEVLPGTFKPTWPVQIGAE